MTFLMRGEFDFIRDMKEKFGLDHVGDDCAVLPCSAETDLLVTADLLVEGVDFRLGWTRPEFLGHKALAVSLSDIAAMGGEPRQALLSIAVPDEVWNSGFLDRFYSGWHELARWYEVELVGGDVSRTSGPVIIDSVVLGSVPRGAAIGRTGAAPGDAIYLSGSLGGAAGGLKLLENWDRKVDAADLNALEIRQLRPNPCVEVGIFLRRNNIATAMIDLSDGLSSDLHHLCAASGVGARIEEASIPVDTSLLEHFSAGTAFDLAMNGGEDFELLFTVPREKIPLLENIDIYRIGLVTEDVGKVELIRDGRAIEINPGGYVHFGE